MSAIAKEFSVGHEIVSIAFCFKWIEKHWWFLLYSLKIIRFLELNATQEKGKKNT